MTVPVSIIDALDRGQIAAAESLFREYAAWLDVDLCFQDFETEVAGLPGDYAAPRGALLLAYVGSSLAGCVAMRPLESSICEMKRLWVRETFRGAGVGKRLVKRILQRARAGGYACMRLDTLPKMKSAVGLYSALGFEPIPAYYPTPLEGTIFLEKRLVD